MQIKLDGRIVPIDVRFLPGEPRAVPRPLNWQAEMCACELLRIGIPNVLLAEYDCDLEV